MSKLTPEQEQTLDAMRAFLEGEPVQVLAGQIWSEKHNHGFYISEMQYRRKPGSRVGWVKKFANVDWDSIIHWSSQKPAWVDPKPGQWVRFVEEGEKA